MLTVLRNGGAQPRPLEADAAGLDDRRVSEDPAPELLSLPERWTRGTWGGLAAALIFGVLVDLSVDGPPGVGIALAASAAAAGVWLLARPRRGGLVFFGAGLVLAWLAAARASIPLQLLDISCAVGLFAWGAGFSRAGDAARETALGYLSRGLAVLGSVAVGAAELFGPIGRSLRGPSRVRALPRLTIIVVPIVTLFAVLLGSADPVFAHYLGTPLGTVELGSAPLHALEISAAAFAFAVLLARAKESVRVPGPVRADPILGPVEWKALLASVNVLFAGFVAVQFTAFFGGRTHVVEQQGLTFAEYARTGFAQLLAAAALTGALLAAVWRWGRDRDHLAFRVLALTLVGLSLVVLVSAFRRLTLYEEAYGWTWPRLLGRAAILIVGALLVAGGVAIATRRAAWLPFAAVTIGFAALLVLNISNPDRFIASRNLGRFERTGKIDVEELQSLSADAAPLLLESLPSLPAPERSELTEFLACERDFLAELVDRYGWAGFNPARDSAIEALNRADLGICTDLSVYNYD